jgi:cell division protein FtsN
MLRCASFAAGVAIVGLSGIASAEGDDHDATASMVAELDRDAAHRSLTAEPTEHAKQALERAVRFRALGDEAHARAADGAAREWAETARDLVRAADAETKAVELRRNAVDEQAQIERLRALVDEGIARIGRLRAELDEAERAAREDSKSDRHAVEVHEGDPKPAKKSPKAAPKEPKKTPPKPSGAAGAAP